MPRATSEPQYVRVKSRGTPSETWKIRKTFPDGSRPEVASGIYRRDFQSHREFIEASTAWYWATVERVGPKKITFEEAVTEYWSQVHARIRDKRNHIGMLTRICEELGQVRIEHISQWHPAVQKIITDLKASGRSNTTVRNHLVAIRGVLKFCHLQRDQWNIAWLPEMPPFRS